MRFLDVSVGIWLGLLAIWLAIALAIALPIYVDVKPSYTQVLAAVGGSLVGSVVATIFSVLLCKVIRGTFHRRRRPLAGIAIRVLEAASGRPAQSIPARGISDKAGSLIVSLPREPSDFLAAGDSFLATNVHTKENLGVVEVISVEQDFCLSQVTDRMESPDFWAGLENRMAHDFSSPTGVEFSRYINQDSIDSAKRLIRSWGR